MPDILVPIAEGFEEIEVITIIDILRQAGANVVMAGVTQEFIKGSHGIVLKSDQLLDKINPEKFDMIVLP